MSKKTKLQRSQKKTHKRTSKKYKHSQKLYYGGYLNQSYLNYDFVTPDKITSLKSIIKENQYNMYYFILQQKKYIDSENENPVNYGIFLDNGDNEDIKNVKIINKNSKKYYDNIKQKELYEFDNNNNFGFTDDLIQLNNNSDIKLKDQIEVFVINPFDNTKYKYIKGRPVFEDTYKIDNNIYRTIILDTRGIEQSKIRFYYQDINVNNFIQDVNKALEMKKAHNNSYKGTGINSDKLVLNHGKIEYNTILKEAQEKIKIWSKDFLNFELEYKNKKTQS